ncbi:AlpA family phage regulatory protein [uncultured Pleomorphomonas sp.]
MNRKYWSHQITMLKGATVVSIGKLSNIEYVSDKELATRYGVVRQTIWRWVESEPTFPRPIRLTPGCTRWSLQAIEEWEHGRASMEKAG